MARPMPRDPPVTRATRPTSGSARRTATRSATCMDRLGDRRQRVAASSAVRERRGQPRGAALRAGPRVRAPEVLARSAVACLLAEADAVGPPLLGEGAHALVW